MAITYEWRGGFDNDEVNALPAEALETQVFSDLYFGACGVRPTNAGLIELSP